MDILKKLKEIMNTIKINSLNYSGNNITIINDRVIIDGVDVTPNTKNITIEVTGNLDKLQVGACKSITINGDVNHLSSSSGEVSCDNIRGNVETVSGDIEVDYINGSVETVSGDVHSTSIAGDVKTLSGDIKYKKH